MSNATKIQKAKLWALAGGVFNCLLALPLALPFTHEWYIGVMNNLNSLFNLNGHPWIAPTDGANMLIINTAGLALFLVGMSLIYAAKDIKARITIPLLNGFVRLAWAVIATYYIIAYELLEVLYCIVLADLIFCCAYSYYYFQLKRAPVDNSIVVPSESLSAN
ncbi:hypothetical protein OLMES_5031 [Oleiphilus messinensis]|uniref:Uncharacterized protein n=1 Tax=Oleiphilus messinensis TaxID=141451 RepID=A0A1Y0IEQ3_9GAMM|nr:hypothetical protein [Oleiphilus messinensis]ARU59018.1 hypothetical protein OLMES_5031 [Oleiphilus messinensis]